jgi:hypothetical protein
LKLFASFCYTVIIFLAAIPDSWSQNNEIAEEEQQSPSSGSSPDNSGFNIRVNVAFSDNNPAEVQVTIRCNWGQTNPKSGLLSTGGTLDFEVMAPDGPVSCRISQDTVTGYQPQYFAFDDASGHSKSDEAGCDFIRSSNGDAGFCEIENTLLPSRVEIERIWIDPSAGFDLTFYDELRHSCDSEAWGEYEGSMWFSGKQDQQSFEVLADWEGGTMCNVWPPLQESSVEFDDDDCGYIRLQPGQNLKCTVYLTRLYDKNSPARWYGWVIMSAVVLVLGAVTARQFAGKI